VGISGHGPLLDWRDGVRAGVCHRFGKGRVCDRGPRVDPDIVVENDRPRVINGKDPQLDRGIGKY